MRLGKLRGGKIPSKWVFAGLLLGILILLGLFPSFPINLIQTRSLQPLVWGLRCLYFERESSNGLEHPLESSRIACLSIQYRYIFDTAFSKVTISLNFFKTSIVTKV
jgi:hypothetical protein